ncbi:uncharacterized protein LOC105387752 isoform X3 [Plutella xylostella]|uniref:uncharacterized protein LOC105387752 isoform X3 n=1 Tax=Plutella xylostella TaxID=51655 RepID=UPI002032C167|nr:uncharacterized protein LOC105387752 isoform X3 [Plutella xylostella]
MWKRKMEWTNKQVVRLVREYERHPEVWDSTHELFRVFTAKHEAWEDMAKKFNCEVIDLKKKMNSVLASHRRERCRVRAGRPSCWFLYDALSFLPHHLGNLVPRRAKGGSENEDDGSVQGYQDNQEDDEEQTEYLDIPADDMHEEVIIKQEDQPKKRTVYTTSVGRIKPEYNQRLRLMRNIKRKNTAAPSQGSLAAANSTTDLIRILKRSELLKKKDECDSFGEYIANSLRKHGERTRSMIKHAINNIIFEQEMKKYSGQYDVSIVSGDDDENPLILSNQMSDN